MHMVSTYYTSPLGTLLIQCNNDCISAILFKDEKEEATHSTEHPILQSCVQQLDEYFDGKRKIFDLPLQQQGTDFQTKVWELLYTIPYGKTISYMQLAKQYGDVKAIRAIASANGKNNIAIIVPCHRVIGSNASLTGYAGGLWRKKWLLEHEAQYHSGVQLLDF